MSAKQNKKSSEQDESGFKVVHVNKRARHDYEILDVTEAGIALLGSEVKSIRAGDINLKESYVKIHNGEAALVGCHITPYRYARNQDLNPTRERKLLLHKDEIIKLGVRIQQKGLTVIPLRVYFKHGRCKVELGVGRGKKHEDKREDLKKKQAQREIESAMKYRR